MADDAPRVHNIMTSFDVFILYFKAASIYKLSKQFHRALEVN